MKRNKKKESISRKKDIMAIMNPPKQTFEHPEAKAWREFMKNDPDGYTEYIKEDINPNPTSNEK